MKSKKKKGWKVLVYASSSMDKFIYRSCSMYCYNSSVGYSQRVVSRPKPGCGPLAVFKTRKAALAFMVRYGREDDPLARCEYTPYTGDRKALWDATTTFTDLPKGTVLASKVRLLAEPEKVTIKVICKYVHDK